MSDPDPEQVAAQPRRSIATSVEHVLRLGIEELNAALACEPEPEIPRRVLQKSFFQRLLSDEVLRGMLPGDVSAAQPDLRHLELRQLLTIRSRNAFHTDSCSHQAHSSFLRSVEELIFEKFAKRLCQHAAGELGRLCLLICGVCAQEEGLPSLWALQDNQTWLFHSKELWLRVVDDGFASFADTAIGLVKDDGRPGRQLMWDVRVLDPRVDDVLAELERCAKRSQDPNAMRRLSRDLSDKLEQRSFNQDGSSIPAHLQPSPRALTSSFGPPKKEPARVILAGSPAVVADLPRIDVDPAKLRVAQAPESTPEPVQDLVVDVASTTSWSNFPGPTEREEAVAAQSWCLRPWCCRRRRPEPALPAEPLMAC